MWIKDQILLEEAYKLVCEENSQTNLEQWKPFPPDPRFDKDDPCYCGSEETYSNCHGERMEVGDIVKVLDQEQVSRLNLEKTLTPTYKTQWKKMAGKVGELVGYKKVPNKDVFLNGFNHILSTIYGIKDLNGEVHAIELEIIDEATKKEIDEFKRLRAMYNKLPEVSGIFD